MKKQIKIVAITLLSTFALSCNSSNPAETEGPTVIIQEASPAPQVANQEVYNEPTTAAEKKKMSGALKGALIGAGAGAATGAVVSKKPGKGAVIGGVIGGAAGAVTGDIIENQKAKNQ
ncbi:YMGG-like glycine zipper-containing protein [Arcticibacterium luteifluviistationis]|uniref:YMGG-like Gly-zipper domain-containing protein n=1 Tax=Arcticibacterium luteifluviistationis TaxID=1784714 RepID=A0A2Z4GGP1_9BACT|nr:YMGG-like glycine zipper-containing protein [Arcticibacterium luteifluviistationis]AWW00407.1 hypothetical protein DJ013_20395 [Arcticibacterium luteifluviistationis]